MKWEKDEEELLVKLAEKYNTPMSVYKEFSKTVPTKSYDAVKAKIASMRREFKNLPQEQNEGKAGIEIEEKIITQAMPPSEESLRQTLSNLGYKVEKLSPDKMDRTYDLSKLFDGDVFEFAVISCTHLGSKFHQLTFLKQFYQYVVSRKIKVIFHCGDLVDGINVYKGQEYELFLHGAKAQLDYAIEYYPRFSGKTYVIAGNHDYSFITRAGLDILESLAAARPDIIYLGAYGAYPNIPPVKIYLQHGGGGNAYARSYKLQKVIEQFAPEKKPDLYFLGHYHSTAALFEYRNVTAFQLGCFQAQTPYLRRLGVYPEIGGIIGKVIVNKKWRERTIARMSFEVVPFYVPIENDF
jgi:predicted phosphodiesterase